MSARKGMSETPLQTALRHVAEQEARIADQQSVIARLTVHGQPAQQARELLVSMDELLTQMKAEVLRTLGLGNFEIALSDLGEIGRLAFNKMLSELASARQREVHDQARTTAMQSELTRVARLMAMAQLTASIAHEINQPLAAIVTNGNAGLRWMAHATPNLDKTREALKRIVQNAQHASDVIESMRELFTKGEHRKGPLDINKLIREVLGLMQGELRNEQISVRAELNNELPSVSAKRVQLQLAIRNLIANAIEAMSSVTDRERVLHVRTEIIEPSGVLVAVADSGTGIDSESMGRIFDSFFSTKSRGMGMGLSICRSIVEAHGGQLSASPAHPHGSVFQILLPAAK